LSAEFGKVAVLMGGTSNEREVSLQSGHAVLDALKNKGIDAHPLDPKIDSLEELRNFDRAFICLHGIEGEDGKMQGILDEMMIPYTGSGREASAIGMDKFISKSIWEVHNVLTPKFIKINHESNYEKITQLLDLPFFVKPANSGSSIGINKVRSKEDFLKAFEEANDIDRTVIAEKMISGKEYTLPIINQKTLPIIEIRTKTDFYDYAAKYLRDDTEFICPTDLSLEIIKKVNLIGLRAFDLIGCKGWGRVDFIIDKNEEIFVIEINTIPGMTSHSLVPLSAKNSGISFEDLVITILETSCV
jgi:D-alanine-D-alanine ligase